MVGLDHRATTTQYLPSELLLRIFSFHRLLFGEGNRPPSAAWRWHTLAHVCQRWRYLIFSSLRHLEARLIIPRESPKTPLDTWPALPLSVWYSDDYKPMPKEQEADIVAAFEHSDRIREIRLPMMMGCSFWASICNKSFPELEQLTLFSGRYYITTLPREFLGGSTPLPRLRTIVLSRLHLPALPQLLFSSRGLVSLHLGTHTLTGNGFISPEVLSIALSSTTQLEHLHITSLGVPIEFHPELTSVNSSPHNLVVLPALTFFCFDGFIEYLENLVSWTRAPHLMKLILHFDKSVFDVPQLSRFISRTGQLSSLPFRTSISLGFRDLEIEHQFDCLPSPKEVSCGVYCRDVYMEDLQVSQVGHICAQLSPLASSVKQLKLSVFLLPPTLRRKTDPAPWLQLLTPYNSVEEIDFFGVGERCIGFARALQQSTWETAQELLPALRVLRIHDFDSRPIRIIMLFAAARQLTGRPVIVHCLDEDTDRYVRR